MGTLRLSFASFFQCGIKQFTRATQKDCIHLLFFGKPSRDTTLLKTYTDDMCTRFANGTLSISQDVRADLLALSQEKLMERIQSLGIEDDSLAASSLERLIDVSHLSHSARNKLLKSKDDNEPYQFIADVFQQSIRATLSGNHKLTKKQMEIVQYCITGNYSEQAEQKVDDSESAGFARLRKNSVTHNNYGKESRQLRAEPNPSNAHNDANAFVNGGLWMDEVADFFDIKVDKSASAFFQSPPLKVIHQRAEFPKDFFAALRWCIPEHRDLDLINIDREDIINALHLDIKRRTSDSVIELWKFSGLTGDIAAELKKTDFGMATGCLISIIGEEGMGLDTVEEIASAIQERIHPDAQVVFGACFDKHRQPDTASIVLITSRLRENAQEDEEDPFDQIFKIFGQK